MARRWVRYEAPVMVLVDVDDDTERTEITRVVVGIEPEDVHLARDHRGHFLVYDERMERLNTDVAGSGDWAAAEAIRTAEDRTAWPAADSPDWEEGPDALRYPELYAEPDEYGDAEDDDPEDLAPLNLDEDKPTAQAV